MTHQNQHQEVAQKLVTAYQGQEPLAAYLKKYFAANKKFGSKDRKFIGQLCYQYFRTGKSLADLPVEEAIPVSIFLCNEQPHQSVEKLRSRHRHEDSLDIP